MKSKRSLVLQAGEKYVAIKFDCARKINLGAVEIKSCGAPTGTLNARNRLIELIAEAGGDLAAHPSYNASVDYELRAGGGVGYAGWVDFGDFDSAVSYLGKYFKVLSCGDENPCPEASGVKACKKGREGRGYLSREGIG